MKEFYGIWFTKTLRSGSAFFIKAESEWTWIISLESKANMRLFSEVTTSNLMYSKVFLKIHLFFALVPGIQSRPFDSNLIDRCSCAPINLKSHTTRCLWSPDQFSCSAWCPNQITHFSHSAVEPRAKVNISQIAKCGSIKSLVKCKAGTIKLKLMWSGYIHQHQDCHPYGVVSLFLSELEYFEDQV